MNKEDNTPVSVLIIGVIFASTLAYYLAIDMYLILKKLLHGLARNPPLAPDFVRLELSGPQEPVDRRN